MPEIHIYLKPEDWEVLYALTTAAGLPPSKYIATLINAAHGTTEIKEPNDTKAIRTN